MRVLFLFAAAAALFSQLVIVRSVVAGRAPASSPSRGARWAEIAWVLIPTIALVAILYLTWGRLAGPVALAPISGIQA